MDKRPIRVAFVDYWEPFDEFMTSWLSTKFQVNRISLEEAKTTNEKYFLFFCDETFGHQNQLISTRIGGKSPAIRVFYTGENRRPENYQCHYAISFDHFDTFNHYRLPLYVIDNWVMKNKLGMLDIFEKFEQDRWQISDEKLTQAFNRDKFCSFISGNGACEKRNQWFHILTSYKRVDAHGPLFNNVGGILPRGPEAAKNKNIILPQYKFNLCFENSSYPGYCTEKLFHALYMNTIPIYWGSPTAAMDFNTEAFLNWHNYQDDQEFMNAIVAFDQNDFLYKHMYKQEQIVNPLIFHPDRFVRWFGRIVEKEYV